MVRNKRAAIEMSIGTIVTLVLSVTLLIILIGFITKVGNFGNDIIDQTDDQVMKKITSAFMNGEIEEISIAPIDGALEVKAGSDSQFGLVIGNTLEGVNGATTTFSYEIFVNENDLGTCGKTKAELESLIPTGKSDSGIIVSPGDVSNLLRVPLFIPKGFPTCTFRYRINVYKSDGTPYGSEAMDVRIK